MGESESKVIIVSNRLPFQLAVTSEDVQLTPSVGGLATGMKSVYKNMDSVWIGWAGLSNRDIPGNMKDGIIEAFDRERCFPIFLDHIEVENFYYGFSNKTIWPLFHYFSQFMDYRKEYWDTYVDVNRKYAKAVIDVAGEFDTIWIHDYHLLLLPQMIREKKPNATIGFFLHIPFPSYEIFRTLPLRNQVLEGILGADLVGFHTYDYERHFLSCIKRIIGNEVSKNQILLKDRMVLVEAFPMGIDYNHFYDTALSLAKRKSKNVTKIWKDIESFFAQIPDRKLVLSVDRLDYSKGITSRLEGFEHFLQKYPQFCKKVTLVLLSVPSRSKVDQYQQIKSEVDELVGRINGRFSSINWTPIWYFYRSLPFKSLVSLYHLCDVALITPIRDGMNLVAKEFVATKTDGRGVLILSEMAGAAKEMGEAIIINPLDIDDIADSLKEALEMPVPKQKERILMMQNRLKRYNVDKWANDFLQQLGWMKGRKEKYMASCLSDKIEKKIISQYKRSSNRILFLDYDGTLVGFKKNPRHASPDEELYRILDAIASNQKNQVILISGRDKQALMGWFQKKDYTLIAEHGAWMREPGRRWILTERRNTEWKRSVKPIIESFVDWTPGSFTEEKNFSLVWHFRKADPELGAQRAMELKEELSRVISLESLEILEGNKVIEVKNSGINKGMAALKKLSGIDHDFILAIGDDWTDEYLFKELPSHAVTIKVGIGETSARYHVDSSPSVRRFLSKFIES